MEKQQLNVCSAPEQQHHAEIFAQTVEAVTELFDAQSLSPVHKRQLAATLAAMFHFIATE